jgi:acetylornithine deacetylase/succinyl-diaminopimelate desuccinylase-like protein
MNTGQSSRDEAVDRAVMSYEDGTFFEILRRQVSCRTESQDPASFEVLGQYLGQQIIPMLARLGFSSSLMPNPTQGSHPFLIAERQEDSTLPTVLIYGHGDVVRGDAVAWQSHLSPWDLRVDGDRWYGRGAADNKGQFLINLTALEAAIATGRGRLGFNVRVLFEMGEEVGSPGLHEVAVQYRELLEADLLVASDGIRVSANSPTVFLGSRGELEFELAVDAREHPYHSGNWGGVLSNPAIVLAHAIGTLVDEHGRILVEGLRPPAIPEHIRNLLAHVTIGADIDAPVLDSKWGEPGLTPAEQILGWNTIEVLAIKAGDTDSPVSAIPPSAKAICQLRFVVGTNASLAQSILVKHLADEGLESVKVKLRSHTPATRLDPRDPWVVWALESVARTTSKRPTLLPNLGGTLPNHVFSETLGLPTIWIPHSYPACAQHGPNEHVLGSIVREALGLMAGLWWELGQTGQDIRRSRPSQHRRLGSGV